jgi:hypothetical protein
MKIQFERLNQIIEEEVAEFKKSEQMIQLDKLNEQTLNLTLLTAQIKRIRDLATKDGIQSTLDKYAKALESIK